MSTKSDILRANSSMDWDDFLSVVDVWGPNWHGDSDLDLVTGRNNLDWVMRDVFDIYSGAWKPKGLIQADQLLYRELMFLASIIDHQATLPIDKVYSVYTILEEIGIYLREPDYARTPLEAYQNLTQAWIHSRETLSIIVLSVNSENEDEPRPSRPSWIPDWGKSDQDGPDSQILSKTSYLGLLELLNMDYLLCCASLTISVDLQRIFREPGALSVQGYSLGHIMDCFSTRFTGKIKLNRLEPQTFTMAFRQMCRYVSLMSSYPTGEEVVAVFYRCATYASTAHLKGGDPVLFSKFTDYMDLMLYPSCKQPINNHLIETRSSPGEPDRLEDFIDRLYLNIMASSCNRTELKRIQDGISACSNTLGDGQALFVLENGYMGNAFHSVQAGDEMILLAGCPWPVALRRCEGNYKFIAPAYVHGVMKGERWPEDVGELVDIKII